MLIFAAENLTTDKNLTFMATTAEATRKNLVSVKRSTGVRRVITGFGGKNNRKSITNALLRTLGEDNVTKNSDLFVDLVNNLEEGNNQYNILGYDFVIQPVRAYKKKEAAFVEPTQPKSLVKITLPECITAASNCKTLNEFKEMCPSMYLIAKKKGWLNSVIVFSGDTHTTKTTVKKVRNKMPKGYWNDHDRCMEAAKKCKNRYNFSVKYSNAYLVSRINGWLDEFFPAKEDERKGRNYWTKARILKEAEKYSSAIEFRKGSRGAYNRAGKLHLLKDIEYNKPVVAEEITPEPINPTVVEPTVIEPTVIETNTVTKRQYTIWNEEKVRELAAKYESRTLFARHHHGAEDYAKRHGFLNELFPATEKKIEEVAAPAVAEPVNEEETAVVTNNGFFSRLKKALAILINKDC